MKQFLDFGNVKAPNVTNHRSEAPRSTPGFCYRIRVGNSLVLYLVLCRKLLVPLSFPMSVLCTKTPLPKGQNELGSWIT
jgi:hypothetical protein